MTDDVMDYLYTIINYNKKAHKNKLDKVEYNKNNLIRQRMKKPIAIDGDEKIFSSFIKNDVDIVKLNDKINNYRKNKF